MTNLEERGKMAILRFKEEQRHLEEEQRRFEEANTALILAGWPNALIKARFDPFTYALKLRDGSIIEFEAVSESINLKWAHLTYAKLLTVDRLKTDVTPMTFERGVDVRIDDIVWVADAPWGS